MLPEHLRIAVDIVRRRRRWRSAGVIFIHVPKVAGVSVSHALYGRPLGHFRARDIRRVCPATFNDLVTFGMVRHPVQRLYSAYRFARAGGTAEMGIKHPALYRAAEFSTFDRFVGQWLVRQQQAALDGVFLPQHQYLCDGDEIIVKHVIRLEQLALGMQALSARLGRDIVLGHHNKSSEPSPVIHSAETLAIIQELYHKDFEIFGYSIETTA